MTQDAVAELAPTVGRDDRRRSILIVEDDESQVLMLTWRLESQGYDTLVADRGDRGLALARDRRPDLVILDLRLPDADGLHVCEQLADGQQTCGIPIIIVSGVEQPDIVRRARSSGCTYFLHKPYDPNALLTLIEQSLVGPCDGDW